MQKKQIITTLLIWLFASSLAYSQSPTAKDVKCVGKESDNVYLFSYTLDGKKGYLYKIKPKILKNGDVYAEVGENRLKKYKNVKTGYNIEFKAKLYNTEFTPNTDKLPDAKIYEVEVLSPAVFYNFSFTTLGARIGMGSKRIGFLLESGVKAGEGLYYSNYIKQYNSNKHLLLYSDFFAHVGINVALISAVKNTYYSRASFFRMSVYPLAGIYVAKNFIDEDNFKSDSPVPSFGGGISVDLSYLSLHADAVWREDAVNGGYSPFFKAGIGLTLHSGK